MLIVTKVVSTQLTKNFKVGFKCLLLSLFQGESPWSTKERQEEKQIAITSVESDWNKVTTADRDLLFSPCSSSSNLFIF